MGEYKSGALSKILLWITFFGMAVAAVTTFVII
jgi:hypothetical protein